MARTLGIVNAFYGSFRYLDANTVYAYLVHCSAEHRAETSSGGFRDHCDS